MKKKTKMPRQRLQSSLRIQYQPTRTDLTLTHEFFFRYIKQIIHVCERGIFNAVFFFLLLSPSPFIFWISLARLLTIFLLIFFFFSLNTFNATVYRHIRCSGIKQKSFFLSREQYCIMADEFDLTLSIKLTVH